MMLMSSNLLEASYFSQQITVLSSCTVHTQKCSRLKYLLLNVSVGVQPFYFPVVLRSQLSADVIFVGLNFFKSCVILTDSY